MCRRAGAGDFSNLHVTEALPSDIRHTTNCKMGLHEIFSPPYGVFVKELRNTASSFVISVHPFICPSAWRNSSAIRLICIKFLIGCLTKIFHHVLDVVKSKISRHFT